MAEAGGEPAPRYLPPVRCECGGVEATFDPQTHLFRVHATGGLVRGSKLERLGGKESQKKWRASVRVLEGEHAGRPLGDWMEAFGLEPKLRRPGGGGGAEGGFWGGGLSGASWAAGSRTAVAGGGGGDGRGGNCHVNPAGWIGR